MKTTKRFFAAPVATAVLLAMSAPQVMAEEADDKEIETLVIVGKTTNSVINTEELEKYQANDLADIFRSVPSVSVGGSLGIAQKIYIRGLEDTQLNVTVDGAPQTSTLFHHIGRVSVDPELLKEVEVQAGAGEATAGAGSIGGAIRFKTKDINDLLAPDEDFGAKVKASYFSNAGHQASASLFGRLNDDWGLIGSYMSIDRDNMEDGDGNEISGTAPEQTLGFVKLSGEISDTQSLSISYETREEEGEFVQRPNWPESDWNPLYPLTVERDTVVLNHSYNKSDFINLETTAYITEASVEQDGRWGLYRGEVSSAGFDIRNTSILGLHTLTYGIEHRKDEVESGAPGEVGAKEKGRVTGFYIQDHWQATQQLLVSFGARFDQYDLDQVTYENGANSNGFSPNIGIEYQFNDNWVLNLGYAEAMRGKEVGDSFTIENGGTSLAPDLKAEEVDNTELALTYRDTSWHVTASVYQSEIDNVIQDKIAAGSYYENVGKFETKGFELRAGYWFENLSIDASYTNSDPELNGQTVEGYEANGLANARGDTWGLNVNYMLSDSLELGWNMSYVQDLDNIEVFHRMVEIGWSPETQVIDKPGYQVHDVYVQWMPNDDLVLNLSVQNLLDEQYIDHSSVADYNHIPGWEGVSGIYEAGRDIRLSVSYQF